MDLQLLTELFTLILFLVGCVAHLAFQLPHVRMGYASISIKSPHHARQMMIWQSRYSLPIS